MQLKVFDLRFVRPVSPLDVTTLQPYLIRRVPALESTLLVLSQTGEFQLLDLRGLVTPPGMVVHRVNTNSEEAVTCSMDVSPACQCFAFGDSSGVVHLWSDREDAVLNPYATQDTVFPDQGAYYTSIIQTMDLMCLDSCMHHQDIETFISLLSSIINTGCNNLHSSKISLSYNDSLIHLTTLDQNMSFFVFFFSCFLLLVFVVVFFCFFSFCVMM